MVSTRGWHGGHRSVLGRRSASASARSPTPRRTRRTSSVLGTSSYSPACVGRQANASSLCTVPRLVGWPLTVWRERPRAASVFFAPILFFFFNFWVASFFAERAAALLKALTALTAVRVGALFSQRRGRSFGALAARLVALRLRVSLRRALCGALRGAAPILSSAAGQGAARSCRTARSPHQRARERRRSPR